MEKMIELLVALSLTKRPQGMFRGLEDAHWAVCCFRRR